MAWRVAESLEVLRRQLNAAFPNRSKVSDGGIGDAAHASRSSDHNPWFKDKKGVGIVSARDFTHDPAGGLDCNKLAAALIKSRDPRIKYIIWNGHICSSKTAPWQWRKYSGKNAHRHHLHLSVMPDSHLFDNPKPWNLTGLLPNKFADLREDEIKLEIPIVSAAAPANLNATNSPSISAAGKTSGLNTAPTATQTEPPPISNQATEETQISAPQGETQVTETKNEQPVDQPAEVFEPEPYNGIGFWATVKKDLAAVTGGNVTFQGLSEYAQQANSVPAWLVPIISKIALVVLVASIGYLLFRVIHFLADSWKKNQRVRTEAEAKTAIDKKDIVWIKPQ